VKLVEPETAPLGKSAKKMFDPKLSRRCGCGESDLQISQEPARARGKATSRTRYFTLNQGQPYCLIWQRKKEGGRYRDSGARPVRGDQLARWGSVHVWHRRGTVRSPEASINDGFLPVCRQRRTVCLRSMEWGRALF